MRKRAIIVLLVVLALACNFPGFRSAGTPMATSETEPGPEGEESPVPSDTATLTPESGIADTPTSISRNYFHYAFYTLFYQSISIWSR